MYCQNPWQPGNDSLAIWEVAIIYMHTCYYCWTTRSPFPSLHSCACCPKTVFSLSQYKVISRTQRHLFTLIAQLLVMLAQLCSLHGLIHNNAKIIKSIKWQLNPGRCFLSCQQEFWEGMYPAASLFIWTGCWNDCDLLLSPGSLWRRALCFISNVKLYAA